MRAIRPTVETLKAARALISDRSKWTQGQGQPLFRAARDAQGQHCNPDDPAAVCWCAHGAIEKFEPSLVGKRWAEDALTTMGIVAAFGLRWYDPVYLNDHGTHAWIATDSHEHSNLTVYHPMLAARTGMGHKHASEVTQGRHPRFCKAP
jgi:hypothetical protein